MIMLVCRSRNATSLSACCTDRYTYFTLIKNVTWLNCFSSLKLEMITCDIPGMHPGSAPRNSAFSVAAATEMSLAGLKQPFCFVVHKETSCNCRELPLLLLPNYTVHLPCFQQGSSMYTDISSPFPGWFHVLPLLLVTAQLQQVAHW